MNLQHKIEDEWLMYDGFLNDSGMSQAVDDTSSSSSSSDDSDATYGRFRQTTSDSPVTNLDKVLRRALVFSPR